MSAPVNVLAALDDDIAVERLMGDERAAEKVRELRNAVAELIEAGHAAMNACTEADQNAADGRLIAALARVGGGQ